MRAGVYRRAHLLDAMLFLPYGVAVDHFQHLVYAHPGASPRERHEMWQEMERRYLPWRDYGDLAHPGERRAVAGEAAHLSRAVLLHRLHARAVLRAAVLGARADGPRGGDLAITSRSARRGGEAPFKELVRSAGLHSPFAPGALSGVVAAARAELLPD